VSGYSLRGTRGTPTLFLMSLLVATQVTSIATAALVTSRAMAEALHQLGTPWRPRSRQSGTRTTGTNVLNARPSTSSTQAANASHVHVDASADLQQAGTTER
jgi:hypothetical protein